MKVIPSILEQLQPFPLDMLYNQHVNVGLRPDVYKLSKWFADFLFGMVKSHR